MQEQKQGAHQAQKTWGLSGLKLIHAVHVDDASTVCQAPGHGKGCNSAFSTVGGQKLSLSSKSGLQISRAQIQSKE